MILFVLLLLKFMILTSLERLLYMRLPIFTTITVLSALTWLYMRRSNRKVGQDTNEFLAREQFANSIRKQPLDSLSYITVPLDSFPFIEDTENEILQECQKTIRSLSEQKIVNLTGISNTDLKLQYGVANITVLSEYDQNFTVLARTLCAWGKELYGLGLKKEAAVVLEFGISCKTDIKSNYMLLADLYIEDHEPDKIDALTETAKTLNSLMKNSILASLAEKRNASGEAPSEES